MSFFDPNVTDRRNPKRIAIVLSNPATSTTTGWPVGFWWSELTHPYLAFTEAGYEVELFSPAGGACVGDALSDPHDASGYSETDLISAGFLALPKLRALIDTTRKVAEIDVATFDAILVAGGQGPMFTFEDATDLHRTFAAFHAAGKIAAALCHGVALLRYVRLADGSPLVAGRTVTGFSNAEEDIGDTAVRTTQAVPPDGHLMPWRIEDELRRLGANFVRTSPWRGYAVRDGNLITGQQNFSGAATAALVIEALGR